MSERRAKLKPPRRSSQTSDSSSSSETTSSPSSEDEETDARDLKPIKEYLNDRRELASQLFKSVKLEKIRMMLPQVLKSVNLYDIEEWCGNELSGMSRKRILSIISGQRMAESSDTEETDDSGPSLEIISDTEEWLTDDEVMIKKENMSDKSKRKKHTDKVKGKTRPNLKDKATANQGKNNKSANINVKIEGEKPEVKETESLLDLLELEMRARAIRALIRKEEDIIPGKSSGNTSSTTNSSNAAINVNASTSKYVVQEMQQISVTLKQGSGLDDDVMLVIQPAPTIELLSSESENEGDKEKEEGTCENKILESEQENRKEEENKQKANGIDESDKGEQSKRINKRLENERGTDTTHSTSTIGDDPIEIQDNDHTKPEEHSPQNSEKHESEFVIKTGEKLQKSPKKVKTKNADKGLDQSSHESVDKESNKLSDKSTEEMLDKSENVSNSKEKNSTNKVDDQDKTEEKEQKSTNAPKKDQEMTTETNNITEAPKSTESTEETEVSLEQQKSPEKELEEGELASESDSKEAEVSDQENKKQLLRRFKKRRRRRSRVSESSEEESEDSDQSGFNKSEKIKSKSRKKIRNNTKDTKGINSKEPENEIAEKKNVVEIDSKEEVKNEDERAKVDERKLSELKKKQEDFDKADMEEIIDLDDYPDDMDDLENNQQSTTDLKQSDSTKAISESSAEKMEPAETWASRYYNTDDVQNVIKESKIQSEIRKRLRERQRLSKLSNSPNINKTGCDSPIDIKVEEARQKPLGSVEEYLALKAAAAVAETSDSTVSKKSENEKSRKSHRRRDLSHKSKSHSSKRKSKSDRKSSKDVGDSSSKLRDAPKVSSVELRPD